jgi:hypothetical protein
MKYLLVSLMTAVGIMNLQAQNVPSYVPTNGLVGYWPFNGNANDESGNGNNLSNNNGVTYSIDRFGQNNSCSNFNGINQTLSKVNPNLLSGNSHRTISCWINSAISQYQSTSLVNINDGANGGCFTSSSLEAGTNNSGFLFWKRCNDVAWNQAYLQSQWYHVVITYKSDSIKLYLNNVVINTSSVLNGGLNTIATNIIIGGGQTNDNINGFWNGKIDDVAIYNRVLTTQEITALFTSSTCTPPTAAITPATSTSFCAGGSVILNANTDTTFSYQWQLNGTNISGATNASYIATASGNYTVIISNATNCADTSSAVNVTVNPVPSATIAAMGNTTFCSGGSVMLSSNSGTGFTYVWKKNGNAITGATSSTYSATTSGTYNVQVTNSNNCSSTSTSITVTVNPSPTATLSAATSTTFCTGGSVVLNANTGTGLTYQWKKNNTNISGATSASYTATTQGSYVIVVSGSNGCTATSTATTVTVNPTPTVTLTSLPAFVNLAAAAINLNGSPTGGFYSGAGAQGNTFLASTAGLGSSTITYNYTNANGCSSSAFQSTIVYDTTGTVCTTYDTVTTLVTVTDTLVINAVITSLAPPNNLNTIKIYPNPTSDHITINYGNYAIMSGYQLKIENALGQVVFTTPINLASSYVDLSTWSGNGIYFVKIINSTGSVVENRKIVLQ